MSAPHLRVCVLTAFPQWLQAPLGSGVLGRAAAAGLVAVDAVDLRAFTQDRHHTLDDAPFGLGAGMLMKAEPVLAALDAVAAGGGAVRVLLAPDGERFDQAMAAELAQAEMLVLVCGRYEGIDDRVRAAVDRVVSLGDFVVMGGEAAAWAVAEAVARLVPGVVEARSLEEESFGDDGLLEAPQYTRPASFERAGRSWAVPPVVRAGDHGRERRARRRSALCRTLLRRPDLLRGRPSAAGDSALWGEILVAAATWADAAADWSEQMLY
jgi:tRNA (guanine37-N1)-methyltransferase